MDCPANVLVAGPTKAGKTKFVLEVLKQNILKPPPQRIVYCYAEDQPVFSEWRDKIEFIKGFPKELAFDPDKSNVLILDDLMTQARSSVDIADLFTRGSHHRNVTVFLLVQNLFFQGRESRTISLNAHYMCIFKNPRDASQISHLARQIYPEKRGGMRRSGSAVHLVVEFQ